jgi:hypothetical protein
MPEKSKQPKGQDVTLSMSPVILALDPQPSDLRNFVFLEGYIGEVNDSYVQLYPKLDLRTYFKVPRGAIKFAELADPDRATSQTRLVIDASAQVEIVKHDSVTFDAGYLSGAIAAANLPRAEPEPILQRGAAPAAPVVCLAPCAPPPPVKAGIGIPPTTCAHPCHTAPLFG